MPRAAKAKPSVKAKPAASGRKKRKAPAAVPTPQPGSLEDRLSPTVQPIKDHDYVPPDNTSPDDPPPEAIVWQGEHVTCNVTIWDACMLYCLERGDLADLCTEGRMWLDIKTVAVRALRKHGGFTAHKSRIIERRQAEYDYMVEHNLKEHDKLSPGLTDFMREMTDGYMGSYGSSLSREEQKKRDDEEKDRRRRQVKQYAPLYHLCMDDYGCEWQWCHGFGSYLSEETFE